MKTITYCCGHQQLVPDEWDDSSSSPCDDCYIPWAPEPPEPMTEEQAKSTAELQQTIADYGFDFSWE